MSGNAGPEWDVRKDPQKFEFGDGAELVGVLTKVERVSVRDPRTNVPKSAVRYSVTEQESGELVFFFGTYQIDSKLRPSDVGHFVCVRCEGESDVERNGNKMKLFAVAVDKRPAPGWAHDSTQITDGDMPF